MEPPRVTAPPSDSAAPPPAEAPRASAAVTDSSAPKPLPARRRPWAEFSGRFMVGHMLAYPVGMGAAMAFMPLAMLLREDALNRAGQDASDIVRRGAETAERILGTPISPDELGMLQIIMEFVGAVAIALMLVLHITVIPWSIAAARVARTFRDGGDPAPVLLREKKAARMFWASFATTVGVIAVVGAGAWIWLFTL